LIPDHRGNTSAIWHKVGMPYNQKFEILWSLVSSSKFNISEYVEYERKEGGLAMNKYPLYKVNGRYNSIRYRRGQVLSTLINNIQLDNNIAIKDKYDMAKYDNDDCKEDFDLFNNWKDNEGLNTYNEWKKTIFNENNKISMCFEYSKFISNLKIEDKYIDLPNINNLI
jgi:hypothetical protein